MKRRLHIFLISIFIFCISYLAEATHIVGGSLTYVYNGGSNYTLTLKLFRDCSSGTAAFPASVTITVLGYDSTTFSPSKDFTMNLGTVTKVPSNLDSCATPPNPMPCVEQGIYTLTVNNLPPNPGGYHLYYQLIARNLSLTNVNATCNCVGESFYAYIPGQSVYWVEDFTLANGTKIDNGSTAWTISAGAIAPNSAQVNNKLFEIKGANNGQETWTSQVINISAYPLGANVTVDLSKSGTLDADDSVMVYYSLNGGPLTLFSVNGFFVGNFAASTASQSGLVGNTIQLFVRVHYGANSPNSEIYRFDHVLVYGNDFILNNDPVFKLFPPLFLCVATPFTFDHSATDADGDSLVYSFYTPYDGDNGAGSKDPSFLGGNTAIFQPVIWQPGFSATNPLGGAPLILNSKTGLLSGTPGMLGQYVVGVKVKEYRNGIYIGETLRDFQFNIVNCSPPAQAILSPFTTCSGNTTKFTSGDTTGANYWWNFGDLSTLKDTSRLKSPSYIYPGPGTYTVTLITNKGTSCADTATTQVKISWVTANFTQNSPKCVGNAVSFTDNSTKSPNSTITGWSWGFGDGNSSTAQNPSHTYLTAGTFTVTLTASSNLSCSSITTQTVTVDPKPIANAGSDQVVCGNNAAVTLNGTVTNAAGGTWTTNGTGGFTPNNTTLNATYTPSNADTAARKIKLILTTTGNGNCGAATDTMVVTITDAPTVANAGTDQTICGITSATLTGNSPLVGTGQWTIVLGVATITNPNSAITTVTGLTAGSSYTFRWTVSSAACISSKDDVIINVDLLPTTANAGTDQTICNTTTTTLAGNTPAVGTGAWTVVSGSATVTTPTSPTSGVTGLVVGASVTLRWAISKGLCNNSDDVVITVSKLPTVANAGSDQNLCGVTSSTISGNTPITGTGLWTVVSGSGTVTNPNSPTSTVTGLTAGTSSTFRWSISNGACAVSFDDVIIVMDSPPSTANAGIDQTLCGSTNTTLAANTPAVGTGVWTVISGTGIVSNPNSPSSAVTGLTAGAANIFRWTITNSSCSPSSDDVVVYVNIPPTPADAGPDQVVCGQTFATLSANIPAVGTGVWSVVSGAATITNPNAETTTVTGLTTGSSYTFRWTIAATCPASTDDVIINVDIAPTIANAGTDQTLCGSTSTTLSANIPTVGIGAWTIVSGGGTITNPNSPTTTVTGLTPGATNIFRWTITYNACPPSIDDVAIYVNIPPTVANAGPDQTLCNVTSAILSANTPAVGTGVWSVVSGTATITHPDSITTTVTGLTNGSSYTFRWTISATCPPSIDDVTITVALAPTTAAAGIDQRLCNTTTTMLSANTPSAGAGAWSVIYGTAIVTSSTSASTGISGLSPGDSVVMRWTITLGACSNSDDVSIVVNPITTTVMAGSDQSVCNGTTVLLNGTISGGTTTGTWSTTGTGTFLPNANALNASYDESSDDATAGTAKLILTSTNNGVCPALSDTLKLAIITPPNVNAGSAQTVCANKNVVTLSGSVNGITNTGAWSTNGDGIFSSNTNLGSTYTPGNNDMSSGFVKIVLNSTNNSSCSAISDTVLINITPSPVVSAGIDQTICSSSSVQLNGSVSVGSITGAWSTTGLGSFSPDANTLNATYIPDNSDILSGQVKLILTSTGNGNCLPVTDTVQITIFKLPIVNAGSDQSVCSTSNVALNGLIAGGTATGIWTTNGTGSFTPGNTSMNPTYAVSAADVNAGSILFILTCTNNSPCPSITDTMKLSIDKRAVVNAGTSQILCANSTQVLLNGSVSGGTLTGKWSSNGSGSFSPTDSTLNAIYIPGPADNQNGVELELTSTNNKTCSAVSDNIQITFTQLANVDGGSDQSICSGTTVIALNGSVSGSTFTGIWSGTGSGTFSPNSTTLTSTYNISPADVTAGGALLILTSTNNGVCPAVTDTVKLIIHQPATANAGTDQTVCSNSSQIPLNGIIGAGSGTGSWTTNGTGTFSPTDSTLNASYIPGATDTQNGITLTLSSTNNGACPVASATMNITFTKVALVNAGADQAICSSASLITLKGIVSGGTTTATWSTTGGGVFIPNNTSLNSFYNVATSDTALSPVYFILTSTNNGVCPAISDTFKLDIIKKFSTSLIQDTFMCSGSSSVKVNANITGNPNAIAWTSTGTGTFSPDTKSTPVTYTPSAADVSSGKVSIKCVISNNNACSNDSSIMVLHFYPSAVAAFTASKYIVYIPNDPVTFSNNSANANSFHWNFGDGTSSNTTNPVHNYTQVGTYTVTLVAKTNSGCVDSISKEIIVSGDIIFPTAFTPNGSGGNGGAYNPNDYSNNVFFPFAAGIVQFHMMIFNRWGELIFETSDIKTGWDGYYRGKLCQQDTYVWKAEATFNDGRTFGKKGSVTLLR